MTLTPDMVGEFYDLLTEDDILSAIDGLTIKKYIDRKVLATTSDIGNKVVFITKMRSGPFEWNCGGSAGQQREYIRIETVVKVRANALDSEGNEIDAENECKTIKNRVKTLLFTATFNGTGWLGHRETDDRFPSAPTKTRAYHVLTYEVYTTAGS